MAQVSCPRCTRILPPGASKVCIYCGRALTAASTGDPHLGFGFASRPRGDALLGTTVAGRFKVEELIGQGGMGKVYRARHLALDRVVCLKMLKPALLQDPTLVGRFEREAKAASRLNHPNGIQVLDFGRVENDGTLFIVMEYVQGKDLRIVLRDEWPLPEERLCKIMAQVLSALAEAHAHNVIHRDLKPENIMVEQRRDQPDFVKVLDFGIAKIMDADVPGLTRNDAVCGTPQYMAPEQATGSALDNRCDLYSVGVILYQMATGYLPFDGENSMEVLTKHVNDPPVPPRQRHPGAPISEAMESLILRALEKDPKLRPQTADEFQGLLLAVPLAKPRGEVVVTAANAGVVAVPANPLGAKVEPAPERAAAVRPSPPVKSRGTVVAIAGAAAVVVLLVAGAAIRSGGVRAPSAAALPATSGLQQAALQPGRPAPGQPDSRDAARAKDLVLQASVWQRNGDTGTARDLLEQAVQFDPNNAEAHNRLGHLYLNSQPARARKHLEDARRLDSKTYRQEVDTILKEL